MYVIYGRYPVVAKMGRIATFCPICQDLRSYLAFSRDSVAHVYFVPVGDRETHGYFRRCPDCRVELVLPEDELDAIVAVSGESVEDRLARVRPDLAEDANRRLFLMRSASNGTIPADLREALILEPFYLLAPVVENRAKRLRLDWPSGLGVIAALGLMIAARSIWGEFWPEGSGLTAFLAGLGALGTFLVWRVLGDEKRHTRRVVLPLLARSLSPWSMRRHELETVLRSGEATGARICDWIDVDLLERAIMDVPARSDRN